MRLPVAVAFSFVTPRWRPKPLTSYDSNVHIRTEYEVLYSAPIDGKAIEVERRRQLSTYQCSAAFGRQISQESVQQSEKITYACGRKTVQVGKGLI